MTSAVVVVAEFHSTNFDFRAAGETTLLATATLRDGLDEHGRQYNLPTDWYADYIDEFQYTELAVGYCLRDGSVIYPTKGS